MINELTEFTGRNAGRIADEIEAERIKADEAAERAHEDYISDDEMSSAEITAELEAEANPTPVSLPAFLTEEELEALHEESVLRGGCPAPTQEMIDDAEEAEEHRKDEMMRDRDAERAYALKNYGVYGNEVAPDREEEGDPRDEYTYLDSDWQG